MEKVRLGTEEEVKKNWEAIKLNESSRKALFWKVFLNLYLLY